MRWLTRLVSRAVSADVRELSMLLKVVKQDRTMWFRCYQRVTGTLALQRAANARLAVRVAELETALAKYEGVPSP